MLFIAASACARSDVGSAPGAAKEDFITEAGAICDSGNEEFIPLFEYTIESMLDSGDKTTEHFKRATEDGLSPKRSNKRWCEALRSK